LVDRLFLNRLRAISIFAALLTLLTAMFAPDAARAAQPRNTTRYLAWTLGNRISLIGFSYGMGARKETVDQQIDVMRPAAEELGAQIPPLPAERTGNQAADSAMMLRYLLHDCQVRIGEMINENYSPDHMALFEVGLRGHMLTVPVVDKVNSRAPQCQRLFRQLGFRLRKPRPQVAQSDPLKVAAVKKTPSPGSAHRRRTVEPG